MSKTKLNQIAPADLVPEFGVDAYRYHFLRDLPFGADGDFSYEGMVARYNADLANNFGNLLSRVATVVGKKCGGVGPAPDPSSRAPPSFPANDRTVRICRRIVATDAHRMAGSCGSTAIATASRGMARTRPGRSRRPWRSA